MYSTMRDGRFSRAKSCSSVPAREGERGKLIYR
jgi:hypothetical protein